MWLTWSWLAGALLMGLAGGVHCASMCGSICVAAGLTRERNLMLAARAAAYILVGAVAGGFFELAAQLTLAVSALKPLMHLALGLVMAHGLYVAVTGRSWARGLGRSGQAVVHIPLRGLRAGAVVMGASLPLLPCGLFYGAVALAALSGSALAGATTMAAFVVGSSPWLWAAVRMMGQPGPGRWQRPLLRLAGLICAAAAALALWHGDLGAVLCR
jgi:uncharacterized protein